MKKYLTYGLMALVLFGLSAAGSWFFKKTQHPAEEAAAHPQGESHAKSSDHGERQAASSHAHPSEKATPEVRLPIRAPYTPGVEEAVQLAAKLREDQAKLKEQQVRRAAQQKQLEMIYQDIRSERAALDELRKQLSEELKSIEEQMAAVEKRHGELDEHGERMNGQVKELEKRVVDLEGVERKNVDRMADIYNSMDAEGAAKILVQMANSGNMDTAVKILGEMKERQAAKVLAALPENVAVQLLDRLKGLKRSPSSAKP